MMLPLPYFLVRKICRSSLFSPNIKKIIRAKNLYLVSPTPRTCPPKTKAFLSAFSIPNVVFNFGLGVKLLHCSCWYRTGFTLGCGTFSLASISRIFKGSCSCFEVNMHILHRNICLAFQHWTNRNNLGNRIWPNKDRFCLILSQTVRKIYFYTEYLKTSFVK